jgi:hypothetical protein
MLDYQKMSLKTLKKYTYYQNDSNYYKESKKFNLKLEGHQLLDVCSSGIKPLYKYSQEFSEDSTINDIKEIAISIPESVYCDIGTMRCRDRITALYFACLNPNIPLETIKFLVEKGANPSRSIKLNGFWIPIIEDILNHQSKKYNKEQLERFKQIQEYFDSIGPFVNEDSDNEWDSDEENE